MIKDILKYTNKMFSDSIDIEDFNCWILIPCNPEGSYDLSDKLRFESIKYLDEKYNKIWIYNESDWYKNIYEKLAKYDQKLIEELICHAKGLLINVFWEENWNKAYKNFLDSVIIWSINSELYKNIIKNNDYFINFLENELGELFKYFPDKEYKVWFVIDRIYWYDNSFNLKYIDNFWETDRYNYWRRFKNKWIVKEMWK